MKKPVRYGLLGFGGIARNRIAKEGFGKGEGFAAPYNAELVAAHDIDNSGKGLAESWGLKWFGSAGGLLADPGIDAVFVASTNSAHAPLARLALESGKHCLIEKPVATTETDAGMLVELARKKGLSLGVDHMMTRNVLNIRSGQMASSGEIGAVRGICLHMEFLYGAAREEASSWRCSKPDELGGPIGDVGSHCLYMAEFLLKDRISMLSSVYSPQIMDIKVENGALINFNTEKGFHGSARVSFAENRGGLAGTLLNLGYEIYGDNAVIRAYGTMFQLSGHPEEPVSQRLEVDDGKKVTTIRPEDIGPENIYGKVIEEHARSILEGNPLSGEDGLWNLRLINAAHESATRNGEKIFLEKMAV